ncbi:hypothetical protein PYW08_006995 [Mythimna loreyi]|uniref:Uncharacterized protein n=1 Tax=Mythimna loreyi TaxID=667449 RepID=A0ACC2R9G2_9NEOP|nr:hypothetical protein PYW08_006995 [Mythimna loreyi]
MMYFMVQKVFHRDTFCTTRKEHAKSALHNLNPVQIFEILFDDNILEMIVHNSKILFVRWLDNSVCTMGTNFESVEPLGKVKRWCSTRRQKVDVDIPHVFQSYNAGMGGVDQADQSISLYRVSLRGKKWWWVLFTYMLDVTISNAWRLHIMSSQKDDRMDQLQFRRYIIGPSASNLQSLQYQSVGHFPLKLAKQLRYTVCHAKARWQCKLCLKTLCVEKICFESFHTA